MNILGADLQDFARLSGAWPTRDEIFAAVPQGRRNQVDAMIAELVAEGSIHIGANGRIRVLPLFRSDVV